MCNMSLPISRRVDDLVLRLTLNEKISSLGNSQPGLPSIGAPPFQWWSEGLHGIAKSAGVTFGAAVPFATSFPQVLLTA